MDSFARQLHVVILAWLIITLRLPISVPPWLRGPFLAL